MTLDWVDVKERLPEQGEDALVAIMLKTKDDLFDDLVVSAGTYDHIVGTWYLGDGFYEREVWYGRGVIFAWMSMTEILIRQANWREIYKSYNETNNNFYILRRIYYES